MNALTDVRLKHLARRIHALGPRPIFELFHELLAGADVCERIEAFAEIDADLVRDHGANEFPPSLTVQECTRGLSE